MNIRNRMALGIGAWLVGSAAFAAQPRTTDEQLVMPLFPAKWAQVYERHGEQDLVEYIPEGETADQWQSKITVETYRNLNLPLDTLQRRAVAQSHDSCDGVVEGKFQSGVNNGFASAFWTLGCKHHKRTGFGEARYSKAVQGQGTLYVITRIWRTKAFGDAGPAVPPAAIKEGLAFLTSTVVCQTGSAQHPCPAK
ncbi:MAG: hypothetical protein EXQ84_07210 [Rhodospirillaceae bacterium]|nr:hypothetical protein [Rhodospirillaceae bacterium]